MYVIMASNGKNSKPMEFHKAAALGMKLRAYGMVVTLVKVA